MHGDSDLGITLQEKLQSLVGREGDGHDTENGGSSSQGTLSPENAAASPEALLTQALERRVHGSATNNHATQAEGVSSPRGGSSSRHGSRSVTSSYTTRHASSSVSTGMDVDDIPEPNSPNRLFEQMFGGSAATPPVGSAKSSPRFPGGEQNLMELKWNTVPTDEKKLAELVDIYFTWEYSACSPICKEPFLKDLASRRRRYCCEALVNAIMARSYQMMQSAGEPVKKDQVLELYRKAQSLITIERNLVETPLPLIQALSVLSCVDGTYGRSQQAWNRAFEAARYSILVFGDKDDEELDEDYGMVRANTFCGAVGVACILRIISRRLDPVGAPLFMSISGDESETLEVRMERGMKLQKLFYEYLPFCPLRTRFVWENVNLVHGFLMYHSDNKSASESKADLFEYYPQVLKSWNRARAEFGHEDQTSPDNLCSTMHWHWIVLLLFKPYINDRSLEPTLSPRKILAESCRTIIQLAWHQKTTWGLGYANISFPHTLGLAAEIWVSLTRPSAMSLTVGDDDWAALTASSAELTGKAIIMLNEVSGFYAVAKRSLGVIDEIYSTWEKPVGTVMYTQGTTANIEDGMGGGV